MGLIDFVKKAGAKVFGGRDPDDNDATTYKPLRKHVEDHGIDAKDIRFRVDRGAVVVEGHVPDQDTREKVILIVGNVEGVDKVDDRLQIGRAPAATTTAGGPSLGGGPSSTVAHKSGNGGGGDGAWTSKTYTVKSGDTLSAIAKAHYGNANEYKKIFEANKPMLKDPDKIYPGQVLRIPNA